MMTYRKATLSVVFAAALPIVTLASPILASGLFEISKTEIKVVAADQSTGLVASANESTLLQGNTRSGDKLVAVTDTTKQENVRYRATRG
ncbi:hypothetical protein ABWH92_05255 [Ahrensia marina]|uniref:hypothetical protein n=1 Tax=Ahrensia marina TaxID=1514904 RepID=UPI0035CEAD8F